MLTRRSLMMVAALPILQRNVAGTPEASPFASPMATTMKIIGAGTLRDLYGEATFEIDLMVTGDAFEGGFTLEIHATEKVVWKIESTDLVKVGPLSAKTPETKRLTGYATVNGGGEQPFLLDLTDSGEDDTPDKLNFVFGLDALPFLGEPVKQGCDCGVGTALRADFIDGGITIEE